MLKIPVILSLFVLFISLPAQSATILKVKGSKALVDLEGLEVIKGDKLIAIDLYGKTKGIVKVRQVKRNKALVVLVKGKIRKGWILEFSSSSKKEVKKYKSPRKGKRISSPLLRNRSRPGSHAMGLLAGGNFNILDIRDQNRFSGLSWRGALFFDIATFVRWMSIRTIVGYNQFLARDPQNQGQGLLIHYPGTQVLVKLAFLQKHQFRMWGGLGGALFYPFVDQQMDLNLDQRSFKGLHGTASVALGVDTQIGAVYLPVQVELNWINPVMWLSLNRTQQGKKEFKPLYLSLSIGIGFNF